MDSDYVAGPQLHRLLAVDGESRVVIRRLHVNLDFVRIRQHHRTVAQSMRADWRDHDRAQSGKNNRPASGECVCGRARGSCDDQSVGAIRAEGFMVGEYVEMKHPADRAFADDHVVECQKRQGELLGCAFDDCLEHDASVDFVVAVEYASQRGSRLPDSHFGQEADRKSTRLNSSHLGISYAVFCLKKKMHYTDSLAYVGLFGVARHTNSLTVTD